MKKIVIGTFLTASLLVGCSNEEEASKKDEEKALTETTNTNNTSEQASETSEATKITPEQAEASISKITEKAKNDEQVKDVHVEESEKTVKAVIEFENDITDEEKGIFLFNYQIMLNAAHPDKEIKFEIKE